MAGLVTGPDYSIFFFAVRTEQNNTQNLGTQGWREWHDPHPAKQKAIHLG